MSARALNVATHPQPGRAELSRAPTFPRVWKNLYIGEPGWYCMTRKHFIELARILNRNYASAKLINEVADMCAETNERFDRPRFQKAAGMLSDIREEW